MHRLTLLPILLLLLSPAPALADDRYGIFVVPKLLGGTVIEMRGSIESDSGADLRRALRLHPEIDTIFLDSLGGDVLGALDVAHAVRTLRTLVPEGATCYGACAYVYFAGGAREALGEVGVSQINGDGSLEAGKDVLAELLDALREFGVPDSVIVDMLRTSPGDMRVYEPVELAELGLNSMVQISTVAAGNSAGALLLEASLDGAGQAVPSRGSIVWSAGEDEAGMPMLTAKATFPESGLTAEFMLRRNSDSSLPADAIAEVTFTTIRTFEGHGIASLAGILAKNEQLEQGTPLLGATARIIANQFLFALTGAPIDARANRTLLTGSSFIDLAIVYDTGRRAIVTLGLDDAASVMMSEVIAAWGELPVTAPKPADKSRKSGG
jgi:hypothetical protein